MLWPEPLAFRGFLHDNETSASVRAQLELNLAVVASRSSLVGALLRASLPVKRQPPLVNFLRGLSRDELEVLAEFQGACLLEMQGLTPSKPYSILPDFFDPSITDRWHNADDRAHKTFIVLAWLEYTYKPKRVHSD
ncbi:MAG: hypothetical protein M3N54_05575 [Acidobacteriota bacterium]|nr:hypothetical protein [Acidobacteriota bacterium]